MQDPQSLHKYAYVHGDPVTNTDPTGEFATLVGLAVGFGVYSTLRKADNSRVMAGFAGATAGIAAFATGNIVGGYAFGLAPMWLTKTRRPERDENSRLWIWEDNMRRAIEERIDRDPSLSAIEKQSAKAPIDEFVKKYVRAVNNYADEHFEIEGKGAGWYGWGGGPYGWGGNWIAPERKCHAWTTHLVQQFEGNTYGDNGWVLTAEYDVPKFGDPGNATGIQTHSFITLKIDFNATLTNTNRLKSTKFPVVVLDPWPTGRPDVYDPLLFKQKWPFDQITSPPGQGAFFGHWQQLLSTRTLP